MKRLLFVPLFLAACAPGVVSKSASLPLSEGQVWQYTITETNQTPRTGTIWVKNPNEPKLNGIVSDDMRYPHEAVLLYLAARKSLTLNFSAEVGKITSSCGFTDIDVYQSEFDTDYVSGPPDSRVLGHCSLKRLS